jgi:hypothetical protein
MRGGGILVLKGEDMLDIKVIFADGSVENFRVSGWDIARLQLDTFYYYRKVTGVEYNGKHYPVVPRSDDSYDDDESALDELQELLEAN